MRRLLPLAVPLLLLAACGGGSGTSDLEVIRTAATTTSDSGTARLEMSTTLTGLPGVDGISFDTTGEMDFDGPRFEMDSELPDVPGVPSGSIEQVGEGTVIYQRSELFGELPDGAEWVRLDLAEITETAGVDITQFQSTDPTSGLAMLEGATDDLEEVGSEEVRGESTTHYRATIDLEAAYEDADAVTDPEAFEAFIDEFGDEPIDVEVWIDDEGRVRRQAWVQPMPADGEMEITLEMFDFGEPVDIEVPDEADSVDITELLPD
jgi:hypothetical protein